MLLHLSLLLSLITGTAIAPYLFSCGSQVFFWPSASLGFYFLFRWGRDKYSYIFIGTILGAQFARLSPSASIGLALGVTIQSVLAVKLYDRQPQNSIANLIISSLIASAFATFHLHGNQFAELLINWRGFIIAVLIALPFCQGHQNYLLEKEQASLPLYRDIFLAKAMHKFRNLLNAIIGYATILSDDAKELELSEDFIQGLRTIQSSADIFLDVINQINEVRNIRRNPPTISMVSLKEIINLARNKIEPIITKNGNTLIVTMNDINFINSHQLYLQRIITNLLNNAATFTRNGVIHLEVKELRNKYTVTIKDTGIGLSLEEIENLSISSLHSSKNQGIGFAIASILAKALKGEITIESQTNQGSIFTISLPK